MILIIKHFLLTSIFFQAGIIILVFLEEVKKSERIRKNQYLELKAEYEANAKEKTAIEQQMEQLEKEEQEDLLETIESEDCTPSLAQAIRMKGLSRDNQLNMDKIFEIMTEEKANQKEKLRIPMERVESFFKRGTPPSVMIETVIKALELYRRALNQQKRAEQGNTDRPPEAQKRVKTGDAR